MAPDEIKPEEQSGVAGEQADVGPGSDPAATGEQTERPEEPRKGGPTWA